MGGPGGRGSCLRAYGTWVALACLASGAAGQTHAEASPRAAAVAVSKVRIADDRTSGYVRRALVKARVRLAEPSCRQLFSSGPDANDGSFQLWIDDTSVSMLTGLDNSRSAVDMARLGALSVKSGAAGTLYWDEFESRRLTAIGPL